MSTGWDMDLMSPVACLRCLILGIFDITSTHFMESQNCLDWKGPKNLVPTLLPLDQVAPIPSSLFVNTFQDWGIHDLPGLLTTFALL